MAARPIKPGSSEVRLRYCGHGKPLQQFDDVVLLRWSTRERQFTAPLDDTGTAEESLSANATVQSDISSKVSFISP